jgi:FkbM family methyltransferase
MLKLLAVLRITLSNPLNRADRSAALLRFFRWQFGSWLVPGKVLVPWVNGSRIFAGFRMSGSAGCAYSTLHEFDEMGFVLHFLRKEDLFMDVGANVGVFTVLAGGAIGASCVSVEPGEEAYRHLRDNVLINSMADRVQTVHACISDSDGVCRFVEGDESTLNHVSYGAGAAQGVERTAVRIDSVLKGRVPVLMKIDVEGYEKQALLGARGILRDERLKVVLLELGRHSLKYDVPVGEIHAIMLESGFLPMAYSPLTRELVSLGSYSNRGNTIYVRDASAVRERIDSAPVYEVSGVRI